MYSAMDSIKLNWNKALVIYLEILFHTLFICELYGQAEQILFGRLFPINDFWGALLYLFRSE